MLPRTMHYLPTVLVTLAMIGTACTLDSYPLDLACPFSRFKACVQRKVSLATSCRDDSARHKPPADHRGTTWNRPLANGLSVWHGQVYDDDVKDYIDIDEEEPVPEAAKIMVARKQISDTVLTSPVAPEVTNITESNCDLSFTVQAPRNLLPEPTFREEDSFLQDPYDYKKVLFPSFGSYDRILDTGKPISRKVRSLLSVNCFKHPLKSHGSLHRDCTIA
ncbi:uncharacterized protein LOC135384629 [Ornithodoros turicata]|uniref:uncharacterized protein LOC135384629 n=1 Tax=Ornithodoros turicata TaxID=34597 RepID=UPI003138DA7C